MRTENSENSPTEPKRNARPEPEPDLVAVFVRWTWLRAVFHRGYWLATSLYLVVEAGLSPVQLVFLGTAQGVTGLLAEVPTGVMADTVSRKWSLVVAHVVKGAGMVLTGLVVDFPLLVAATMLWGLGWTFASGADVAWITDELDRPERIAGVLTARARMEQVGAAGGLVAFGLLGSIAGLSLAIVVAGAGMIALGLYVALRFPERNFTPARANRWRESLSILARGVTLARADRQILVVFAATLLINGASEGYERLLAKRLVGLGFPPFAEPVVWMMALGLVMLAIGALALRVVETRIDRAPIAPRIYAQACGLGALGVLVLAATPSASLGMAGALLAGGITWPVTRVVSVVWVNRRARNDVRATVQSFLSQAEYLGEITLGLALGSLAEVTDIPLAYVGSCLLVVLAGALVLRSRAEEV